MSIGFFALITHADAQNFSPIGGFNSQAVATASLGLTPECLNYCFIGQCVYLSCSLFGCAVETVPWVEHNLPDLVVSAYNQPGELPWREARAAYGAPVTQLLQRAIAGLTDLEVMGGGHNTNVAGKSGRDGNSGRDKQRGNSLKFKEVSVIGNPFLDLLPDAVSLGFCPTRTIPFAPYFQSEANGFTWRYLGPERLYPEAYIPRARSVGQGLNEWGGIHPRHGFLLNKDDVHASAVMAARAVDVVTRARQPHLYRQARGLEPSDEKTDLWSMVYPNNEVGICRVFGEFDYSIGRASPDQSYAWLYWSRRDCCLDARGIVVERISIRPMCLN